MPAFCQNIAKIKTMPKSKTTNLVLLPNICFKPSKFKYVMRETIKNAKDKTINKKITGTYPGGAMLPSFLYIKINEAKMPPPIVVGKP